MGLFDWMAEGFGGNGSQPFVNATNNYEGPGAGPMPQPNMPPMQGLDLPQPAAPPMAPAKQPFVDATSGYGGPGGAPDLGPPPPPPMPPGMDPSSLGGPTSMPPGIDPSSIGGLPQIEGEAGRGGNNRSLGLPPSTPPGLPAPTATSTDISAARAPGGVVPPAPPPVLAADPSNPAQSSALGRALGLSPNGERSIFGGLGAGLKAAGNSSGKSPFQAFASGAGETIEGAQKGSDKTIEQQDKYLQRTIAAKKEGNNAEYQKNYLKYQIASAQAKLDAAKEKATSASVMNSPEQLYLRAIGATNQDGGLKVLANEVREAQKLGPDHPKAKEAMARYEAKYKEVRDGHLGTLGVDPSKVKGLESKPGFSDKNPVKSFPKDPAAAQKAFDALPEGAYFVNPKDGRLLTKKSAGGGQPANPAGSASGMTAPIPPIPTAPVAPALEEVE